MNYREKFSCIRTKCGGQLTVPIKVVIKGKRVVEVARCPSCHRSYKYVLPLEEKDQWLPFIAQRFFDCDVCGTSNANNWQYHGHEWHPYWYWAHAHRMRILIRCINCGKRRAKVASTQLWADIICPIEKPPETPKEHALTCPHCNAEIPPDTKICPSCNLEIICDKCGAPILPNANFCRECGDPVQKIKVPSDIDPYQERICPTCQEVYEEGSIYCPVCGQELICDKCGAVIREGALFCVNCGDEVKKGELSE